MPNRYQGVDPVLTSTAIAYENGEYIAPLIFPNFPVKKQSAKHFIYNRGRFAVRDNRRGQGANSKEVTLSLTVGTPYFAEDHSLKQFVADEDVDNAETPTSPFIDATENVMEMHMIAREVDIATILGDTAILTQNVTLAGTDQWSDYQNSNPIADVRLAKSTIHAAIGKDPNTLILGKQVYDVLVDHPAFLERVKYSQLGIMTPELLARIFEVERVLIGSAFKLTNDEGQAETTGYIWGKNAVLAYVAPRIGTKLMTLGLTYTWKQQKTERLRGTDEEDRKGTYVRVGDHYYDQKLVAAAAGYLIKNAVA